MIFISVGQANSMASHEIIFLGEGSERLFEILEEIECRRV